MKFNKIGLVDIIIIAGVIIALCVGLYTAKHFRQTADKQIEATSPITFQVFLRGVTVTSDEFPIKVGEKAFITIRNVPYSELKVIDVKTQPRKTALTGSANKVVAVNDPAQLALYDAIITIEDVAKITKDGAVVDGNKIKIGLPVVLEGDSYKLGGTISDIRVVSEVKVNDSGINNNVG